MAMWASRIFLRWYKSFNTRYDDPDHRGRPARPWEVFGDEHFPFIEVSLDSRIATVVGANESGKSHLLSAIEKIAKGWSTTETGIEQYDLHHLCRYCALDGLQQNVWPRLGIEITFGQATEYDSCLGQCGLTRQGGTPTDSARVLRFFIDGGRSDEEFTEVYDHADNRVGVVAKGAWFKAAKAALPSVHFVHSRLAMSNEIHIDQLIGLYESSETTQAIEPLHLQTLASELLSFSLPVGKAIDEATNTEWNTLKTKVSEHRLGPKSGQFLEMLLFRQILDVPKTTLVRVRDLNSTNRGFVERILDEINHRLNESLDLSQFWQQDDDFTLKVDYKGGFFYFRVTDKTGASYTFDERSSGLRYFLSYYIQAKAIRDSLDDKGAIVVMDEPDSYLSAAGQRNLLTVFESLATPDAKERRCQLVYTTHSPFLINRNFPRRISLVRKGDGSEGTQVVELTSTRQYEPVRTGLGIESAETLFMGSSNIVLEGISDQKVLVAAIQRFGDASRVDDMLDLNRATFVSASGVYDVPRLITTTKRAQDKRPAAVVFIDGDANGHKVAHQLVESKLLHEDFVCTIADVGIAPSWTANPRELEDIIPPVHLAAAVVAYLKTNWNTDVVREHIETQLADLAHGATMAARLEQVLRMALGSEATAVSGVELRAGVFDTFAHLLATTQDLSADSKLMEGLAEFEKIVRAICARLTAMLVAAETSTRRDRLRKNVRLEIERFRKAHGKSATKADVARCLSRIDDACVDSSENARKTRENAGNLVQLLNGEMRNAGDLVTIALWHERLQVVWDCPWHS